MIKGNLLMERLNFNHLYYFYVVAKEGSIKESALKLHVSQPTISDQIKLLEEFFDCKLFLRKNRSLELTKEGLVALEYATTIFDQGQELTTKLRHKLSLPKNSIDIGITNHVSENFLFESLLPLLKEQNFLVNVKQDKRHLLLAELEEGNIDIMFTDHLENLSNSLISFRHGVSKTYALAHESFKKSKKNFPVSLSDIPFLHYGSDSILRDEINYFFSRQRFTPKVMGESSNIDYFKVFVENKLGFVIVTQAIKNRLCMNPDIIVLGEIKDLQTSVFAVVQKDYDKEALSLIKNP